MIPRILLFGRDGQLGRALYPVLAAFGNVTALGRSDLDLADATRVRDTIAALAPSLIVNAAGYVAVDRAESEADLAHSVNARAVEVMGEAALELGGLVIHFSTDYVFDGNLRRPYREEDRPAPLGAYGASKLAGELALQASGARYFTFRLSWLYATQGRNFFVTMRNLFRERDCVPAVNDRFGTPTWTGTVARAIDHVLSRARDNGETGAGSFALADDRLGLYHISSGEDVTWFGFASAIRDELGCDVDVVPITSAEYPSLAARPEYAVLESTRFRSAFDCALPDWRPQLACAVHGLTRDARSS